MAKNSDTTTDHDKTSEPKEKPKNQLNCSIICVAKKSKFRISLKKTRIRKSTNIFNLEFQEYQSKSYTKKATCPNCMSKLEITVKSEKAGLLYYKVIIIISVLILIIANYLILSNLDIQSYGLDAVGINALIIGSMVSLLVLKMIYNYLKIRSVRSIRLKIKAEYSSMTHHLYKAQRTELKKKGSKILT